MRGAPIGNQYALKNKPLPPKYKICKCGNKLGNRNKSGVCQKCKMKQVKQRKKENKYFKDIELNRTISFAATPQKIEQWLKT
jgi:hypothetical protein